jgi:hypothetical protein
MEVVERFKAMWGRSVSLGTILSALIVVLLLYEGLPRLAAHLLRQSVASLPEGLELKDFIIKVKSDLEAADRAAVVQGQVPLLELQDVELEANFVVQSHAETEVKLVTVNGTALAGLERSQKIVLHLKPVPRRDVAVSSSQAPIVTGPGHGEVIHMKPADSPPN